MSRQQIQILVLGAALLAACKSGAPEPPVLTTPAEPVTAIMYRTPSAPTSLSYSFADTTHSNIQAGPAGTINVTITSRGTAELRFEPDSKVSVTLTEFVGQFSNSAGGGTMQATLADIKGPAVFSLDARGVATLISRPEMSANFRTVVGSENNLRRFFARVAGGPVQPGTAWTDTLTAEESNEGINSRLRNIVRITYVRDTVIAGRTLYVLTGEGERWLDVSGVSQGVEIVQKLTGRITATVLWDPVRSALVLKDERATLTGTFDLPAMSLTGLPINATGRTLIQLKS